MALAISLRAPGTGGVARATVRAPRGRAVASTPLRPPM